MSYINAALFLVVYFVMGYFAIFVDSLILHGKFTPAANIVVLILSLKWVVFKGWSSAGAKTKHAILWSIFSSIVAIVYLHVLHYISKSIIGIHFDQINVPWTISVFAFNFCISFASLKFFQHIDREKKEPASP